MTRKFQMKKTAAFLLASAVLLSLTGCTVKSNSQNLSAGEQEMEDGGWMLNDEFRESEMSEEEKERFQAAGKDIQDVSLTPIACLGSQVVAGLNYIYLCYGEPDGNARTALYTVKIYQDLTGNVSVTETNKVDADMLAGLFDQEEEDTDGEVLAGGWTLNENMSGVFLPGDSLTAFGNAVMELSDVTYLPLALAGSQVAAGMNYMVLAKEVSADGERICVMRIYAPADGSASEITDTRTWKFWE